MNRRHFLETLALGAAGAIAPLPIVRASTDTRVRLEIGRRTIEVSGRAASVYRLAQSDGRSGLVMRAGERFQVDLINSLDEPTSIHWHGLTPPWAQDGVPGQPQAPIAPGGRASFDFLVERPGTNWMHSHFGLQEQQILAAPLIVRDADANEDVRDIVAMFHDFTFNDPLEVFAQLRGGSHGVQPASGDHAAMGHSAPAVAIAGAAHVRDITYDAFLANDRTLDDPEIHRVDPGSQIRLRLINAATATNFWLDLGALDGQLIAVDGMPVQPLSKRRFEFAIAQRLDILIRVPREEGVWPVLALVEGSRERAGFVLATRKAIVPKLATLHSTTAPPVGIALESALRARQPLSARAADRTARIILEEGPGYTWAIAPQSHPTEQLRIRRGERVELTLVDQTSMAHPIHLHGHHFQVTAINGRRIDGAVRDTVLVPASGNVTIAFDANNPGVWPLHCHHLYHMAAGMTMNIAYDPVS